MIYEEASTSPLVDSRRIREAYILILVTGTRTLTGEDVTEPWAWKPLRSERLPRNSPACTYACARIYSFFARPLLLMGKRQGASVTFMKCCRCLREDSFPCRKLYSSLVFQRITVFEVLLLRDICTAFKCRRTDTALDFSY